MDEGNVVLIIIVAIIVGFIIGAIAHEKDMYRNLKRTGNASAWTCKITSKEMKIKCPK